ncbi:DNA repair exonuclease [Psychromarinibacter sp. C21-152]|uniref:DNA repair exonuclease n=1 Tax=Psychromarinibacter sediminicola TaxID=3033385 RepID=A0AAE3NQV0_9RHOB|nr:DNA repair exonuclease [Psychromarinibacter sediminicola]MDF0599265.1 DNA repair exonuclease [Psychromarinibacter sediminicola]
MTAVRLLHTADLHLDSPLKSLALRDSGLRAEVETASRSALTRMVDFALAEDVAALLIAGDLFDGAERSAKTAAFLLTQLDRLNEAGISVFYIRGNHDVENPVSGAFEMPTNVHVFDGRGGSVQLEGTDIHIHGVSFRDRHAPESLLPKFAGPVPGAVNIGMLHTSLSGAAGHDPYAPCTVPELQAHGFDYWALGHVHKRSVHADAPFVVMPGMPQGRDIGEAGPKSATLLTVTDGAISIEEVPTSAVEFRRSALDITGADDAESLRAALRDHLRTEAAATVSDTAILRLSLTGESPRAWQIRRDLDVWQEAAEGFAEATGTLRIERLELDLTAPGAADASDAVSELESLMAEIRREPGFRAEAQAELDRILSLLPADRRRALAADADALAALADDLAARGALAVAARMRGAHN